MVAFVDLEKGEIAAPTHLALVALGATPAAKTTPLATSARPTPPSPTPTPERSATQLLFASPPINFSTPSGKLAAVGAGRGAMAADEREIQIVDGHGASAPAPAPAPATGPVPVWIPLSGARAVVVWELRPRSP